MSDSNTPNCRACKSALTATFLDLGLSPISNAFVRRENLSQGEMFFPLHARVCPQCFLVQIDDCGSPENHFHENYAYFSSFSPSWVKHAEVYSEKMINEQKLTAASHVIEVASNDGYLLQHFVKRGIPCMGVEPSANVAREAEKKGVRSLVRFFGTETASELVRDGLSADLLLGNNVVAHVPDINDFVAGLKIALKPDGLITLEFPHLLRQIEGNQFDTIYHEHFSYISLMALTSIFERHGLNIFDVEEITTHGGSLRIYGKHNNRVVEKTARFHKVMNDEIAAGLNKIDSYKEFATAAAKVKFDFLEFLAREKRNGKTIAAYGAPAKGNTLLNYCGIRTDLIEYTVDRSTFKQGTFLPGTRLEVFSPEKISETKPDYVVLLPWNLKSEIVEQMAEIRSWGGKFVVAIPNLQVF